MSISSYLSSILHVGAQYMLVPTMVFLIILLLVSVFSLGWVLVEYLTERRHFKVSHRAVIARIHDANYTGIVDVIEHADLLKAQVTALSNVARNMGLPDDELFAMAQVELERTDTHYRRRVNLTDTISKVGPMCGLLGTLIPLGPGIMAMGQGDVSQLSSSMLVAFDTTIAGLIAAVLSLIISRIRRTWYGQYNTMMEALMGCILEEAARARDEGVNLPYGPGREETGTPELSSATSTGKGSFGTGRTNELQGVGR